MIYIINRIIMRKTLRFLVFFVMSILCLGTVNASTEYDKYVKVKDASSISQFQVLLLVNESHKVALGLPKRVGGVYIYESVTDVTINNDTLTTTSESPVVYSKFIDYVLESDKGTLALADGKISTTNSVDNSEITIGEDGNAVIKIGNDAISYDSKNRCFSSQKGESVQLYRKITPDVTLNVGSTGYATLFYWDRDLIVPEKVNAMTYTFSETKKTLKVSHTYTSGTVVPRRSAVVVKAESGEYTFKVADKVTGYEWFDPDKATETTPYYDGYNVLSGYDNADTTRYNGPGYDENSKDGFYYYKLAVKNNNVGFYWGAKDGHQFIIPAHKAYLAVDDRQINAKDGFIFEDEATGINKRYASSDNNVKLYNLSGQRVKKDYKGIVILKGEKHINK